MRSLGAEERGGGGGGEGDGGASYAMMHDIVGRV